MDLLPQLNSLLAALAIGLLIGLERGWRERNRREGTRVAGFRTFGLLGLMGGVAGLLPPAISAVLLGGASLALSIGYYRSSVRALGRSVTATLVGMLTMALGMLAAHGLIVEAFAACAVTMIMLSMREQLHGWLKGMTEIEIGAAGRFALVALVVLPIMPDRGMGPYAAINPRQIWMVVVLVCALSFTGYLAARRASPVRGLLLTALTGAIVSSTAVTAAYARRLSASAENEGALIAGIAIASVTMFVRVLLLSAVLASSILPTLALTMVPATIVALAFAAWALRGVSESGPAESITLGNPLDFGPALMLAGLVAGLSVLSHWAVERFGDAGIVVLLTLTGIGDVDAAVLTLAGLPEGMLRPEVAGVILACPVLANTALKAVMIPLLSPNRRGLKAMAPLVASVVAGAAMLLVII